MSAEKEPFDNSEEPNDSSDEPSDNPEESNDSSNESFDDLIEEIRKLIDRLKQIKIPKNPEIAEIIDLTKQIRKFYNSIITCFNKILNLDGLDNDQINEICDEYERFGEQESFLYNELNKRLVEKSADTFNKVNETQANIMKLSNEMDAKFKELNKLSKKVKKESDEVKKQSDDVKKQSEKIFPQLISFSSLFVAVIGLIVSNISSMTNYVESFSLKNVLLINLSFVFAITLIFYIFSLLRAKLIDDKIRKKILFGVFPGILALILIGLVLIAVLM